MLGSLKCFALACMIAVGSVSSGQTGKVATNDSSFSGVIAPSLAARPTAIPKSQKKKFGGSAICQIECNDKNGKVCKQISASCGLNFESEIAAQNALIAQLKAKTQAENGQIKSSFAFSIEWRFE
jgi:hypothetical protein